MTQKSYYQRIIEFAGRAILHKHNYNIISIAQRSAKDRKFCNINTEAVSSKHLQCFKKSKYRINFKRKSRHEAFHVRAFNFHTIILAQAQSPTITHIFSRRVSRISNCSSAMFPLECHIFTLHYT